MHLYITYFVVLPEPVFDISITISKYFIRRVTSKMNSWKKYKKSGAFWRSRQKYLKAIGSNSTILRSDSSSRQKYRKLRLGTDGSDGRKTSTAYDLVVLVVSGPIHTHLVPLRTIEFHLMLLILFHLNHLCTTPYIGPENVSFKS